jgi:hypothetical protein
VRVKWRRENELFSSASLAFSSRCGVERD